MKNKSFEEITVGETASFTHRITRENVTDFARLSGDVSAIHMDEEYARTTKFGGTIVYGMFLAALCSRIVGMYLPGKHCVCVRETLHFRKPARIGDTVEVLGKISAKSDATKIVEIGMEVKIGESVITDGFFTVHVL